MSELIKLPHKKVEDLLVIARKKLPKRLSPAEAFEEFTEGNPIIDIRPYEQLIADGIIPGAVNIRLDVFEWRCDPASEWRDPAIKRDNYEQRLIIMCNQGYQSSLRAATLCDLGLRNVTDIDGGFQAWRNSGLPWKPFIS